MDKPVAAGGIATGTGTIQPTTSTQQITVGETKVSVSGILSPSDAQKIANAINATQSSIWERIGNGTFFGGKTLPVDKGGP